MKVVEIRRRDSEVLIYIQIGDGEHVFTLMQVLEFIVQFFVAYGGYLKQDEKSS